MGKKTSITLTAFLMLTILPPVPMTGAESPVVPPPQSLMDKTGYIDVHNHLFGMTGKGGAFGLSIDYPEAAGAAISLMDNLGISTAIVMPPPFKDGQREILQFHRGNRIQRQIVITSI